MKNHYPITILILLLTLAACGTPEAQLVSQGNDRFAGEEYQAALQAYREAQTIAPDLAEPAYNAANTFYRQQGYEEAQLLMQEALRNAEGELAEFSFYNLGNAFYDSAQFALAVEAYKQALRLNPTDEDAKYNLELALRQLQRQQDQENQLEDLLQDGPDSDQEEPGSQGENEEGSGESGEDEQQEQERPQDAPEQQPQAELPIEDLTREQARQLLEAISRDTESLQEYLQEIFIAPGAPPAKDW